MRELWEHFCNNRGALVSLTLLVLFVLVAVAAPWVSPHDPLQIFDNAYRVAPGMQTGFVLGTDDVGRDLASRLIFGARVSLGVGLMVVLFSTTVGLLLGLWAGYQGGWVDSFVMRLMDILLALPSLLLAIVVVAVLGPGLVHSVYAVSAVALPNIVRIVRASVRAEKNKAYVLAAQTYGAGGLRLAFTHILPNCLAPLIVQATLGFSDGILNVAALGFLGLGAEPPTPEWGTMLSDGRNFIESAPWLVTLPGLCILLVVLAFNLVGDGLRDALDPRLKRA